MQGVSKRYSRRRGARFSLRGLLFGGRRRERATEFWALRDVSFEVRPGGSTALIGGNGAGKSTLLRLAAGLSEPTEGSIEIPRDTVSVLGLGAATRTQGLAAPADGASTSVPSATSMTATPARVARIMSPSSPTTAAHR